MGIELLERLFTLHLAPLIPLPYAWWNAFTRLGEAQILLPALALTAAWLGASAGTRPLARAWLLATAAVAVATTASKVAFIGWEKGYAPFDYSAVSGHAMFAAAILPLLGGLVAGPRSRRVAVVAGYGLALLIAVSRVKIGAHSLVEVLLGAALGGAASALVLWRARWPPVRMPAWMPAALAAWLLLMAAVAPPSRTHDAVTRLALHLSGRPAPYTKTMMRLEYRLKLPHGGPARPGAVR